MQARRFSTKFTPIEERFKQKLANDQRKFEYENQRAIGYTKIPYTPLKSALDCAQSEPWTGEESPIQVSKRMLEDSIRPKKITTQKRLQNARESVLDYCLDMKQQHSRQEVLISSRANKSNWSSTRSMSAGLSSGGWIESIAGMEIENAAKLGKFDSIKRGTQTADLHKDFLESNRNPNIDFTEYLLNKIIQKQGGAPPWIMKQQAVKSRIEFFRRQMKYRLQERLVPKLLKLSNNDVRKAYSLALEGSYNKDEEWESHYSQYHSEFVDSLNSQIRGYNLQAPQTARWAYLNVHDEVAMCLANINDGIEEKLKRHAGTAQITTLNRHKLHSSLPPLEDASKHYGLRQLIKDLFSSKHPQ